MKKGILIFALTLVVLISGCIEEVEDQGSNYLPRNIESGLTHSECIAQGGKVTSVNLEDGTACKISEIDLGVVSDVDCICQCCKPKEEPREEIFDEVMHVGECQKLSEELDNYVGIGSNNPIDNFCDKDYELWIGGVLLDYSCSYVPAYTRYECDMTFQGYKERLNLHISNDEATLPFETGKFYKFDITKTCETRMSAASSGNFPAVKENLILIECALVY
ncbi:MAG: hypothetical protein ABIG20_00580 [archaeon]